MPVMMDILSYVPWWAWVALALGAAAAVRVYTGSWRLALAVLTFGAALAFQSRAYNRGWKARDTKQKTADRDFVDDYRKQENAARGRSGAELDSRNKRWLRD